MFDRLAQHAPTVELKTIHRTKNSDEQRAWQALRAGEPERAMAHYHSRGQLHFADTRDQAAENAVQAWAKLTEHQGDHVAFIAHRRPPGQTRVENGTQGEITEISRDRTITLAIDGSGRTLRVAGEDVESLRLTYAQHVYRQQGATVDRAVSSPAAGRPARRPPTSKPPEPATAPTGTSPATNSAKKATILSASPDSPSG
jgi:AAA domain